MMTAWDEQLLDDVVQRITAAVAPARIVLFGSAARGQVHAHSDLDLLVIMPPGTHRRETARTVRRALRGIGVPKDVVVITEDDVAEHRDNPSLIVKPALDEGREIYAAA